LDRYRIVEYISVFVGDDLMFTAKILFNKKKQEVISVANNLFTYFVVHPLRRLFIHGRHIIFIQSILEGTRRDDI